MNVLGRGLLVAMTALLLTAVGFAQSGVFGSNQYGTDVFRSPDSNQHGTEVFQPAASDQHGTDVFRAADREQHGTEVFHAADRDQYGNEVFHTAYRSERAVDVFQTAGRDPYGSGVFQTSDPRFMREATQDAMAKINIARVALQNAQSEQVKWFAQQTLSDYGQAQRDLFNIAYRQIVVLPDTLNPKHLDTFETLLQLHGAAFDSAYMKAMLSENETAASRFKQEATKGDDWASHTLPTLESNLKDAQKVAVALGVASPATSEEQSTPNASGAISAVSQKP